MVLLARPENGPPGAEGLALFYIEPRDAAGVLRSRRELHELEPTDDGRGLRP